MRYLSTDVGVGMTLSAEFEHLSTDIIYLHIRRRVK